MEYLPYIVGIGIIVAVALIVAIAIRKGVMTTDEAKGITDAVVDLVRQAEDKWADCEKSGKQKKEWVMEQLALMYNAIATTNAVSKLIDNLVSLLNDLNLW